MLEPQQNAVADRHRHLLVHRVPIAILKQTRVRRVVVVLTPIARLQLPTARDVEADVVRQQIELQTAGGIVEDAVVILHIVFVMREVIYDFDLGPLLRRTERRILSYVEIDLRTRRSFGDFI
jgi:hypothetical protein